MVASASAPSNNLARSASGSASSQQLRNCPDVVQ
jgi:hypothetical protein